jgi:hypothetical protein
MAEIIIGATGWVAKGGRYTTDKYGLSTGSYRWEKVTTQDSTPGNPVTGTHPLNNNLVLERSTIGIEDGIAFAEGEYAGIIGGDPPPVYELDVSSSEEPIESHPDFSNFATDANGATYDKTSGEFVGFTKRPLYDPANPNYSVTNAAWVGVRSYLSAGAVWREIRISKTNSVSISDVGHIASPPGSPPSPGGSRTWLCAGASMQRRGNVYTIRREWRLSGRRGWNPIIYQ